MHPNENTNFNRFIPLGKHDSIHIDSIRMTLVNLKKDGSVDWIDLVTDIREGSSTRQLRFYDIEAATILSNINLFRF